MRYAVQLGGVTVDYTQLCDTYSPEPRPLNELHTMIGCTKEDMCALLYN